MPNAKNKGRKVGVLGSGSFGVTLTQLLSIQNEVIVFSRKPEIVDKINETRQHYGVTFNDRVLATSDLEAMAASCKLIFPAIPSTAMRSTMQAFSDFLKPDHILIHATKGFDVQGFSEENFGSQLGREHVHTMSEVIAQETNVVRIGCLSGPNLAAEILAGQPTATVIASKFKEVFELGREVLDSRQFHVFGSFDILGAELSGALKNGIAIGSGILTGKGLGKNLQAMLITRGLMEMVYIGKAMGATSRAFLGTAGIGDLVATATSEKSRNFTFGYRLGKGEDRDHIKETMPEQAEGVRTIQLMYWLGRHYKLHIPITDMLYAVVFKGYDIEKALDYLMTYPYAVDVDFL